MNFLTIAIKYILALFNFLCAVFGIVIVILSALALKELGKDGKEICVSLIVLGITIFIISSFGCCGAISENLCCIWMYAICLIVLVVCNVIISIYIKNFDCSKYAHDDVKLAWRHMIDDSDIMMHLYQSSMECCGKTNWNDYVKSAMRIPMSCYRDYTMTPENLYQNGCSAELTAIYEKAFTRLYVFTWIIFSIEAVALVFAIALAVIYHLEDELNYA